MRRYYHVRLRGTGGRVATHPEEDLVLQQGAHAFPLVGIFFEDKDGKTTFYPWTNVVWVKRNKRRSPAPAA